MDGFPQSWILAARDVDKTDIKFIFVISKANTACKTSANKKCIICNKSVA